MAVTNGVSKHQPKIVRDIGGLDGASWYSLHILFMPSIEYSYALGTSIGTRHNKNKTSLMKEMVKYLTSHSSMFLNQWTQVLILKFY